MGRIPDFAMGAQAEVETNGLNETQVYIGREVAPGFFGWLVPVGDGKALVGVMSRRRPGDYLRRLIAALESRGEIVANSPELRFGGIPLRPLPKTYGDRVLVVGDAAGQVKPTSGGGIYYGLLCAGIAADTLHRALENADLSAGMLYSYEREWRRLLGTELLIGYWSRKLFERLSDRALDRMFRTMDSRGIVDTLGASPDLSFDWHSKVILRMLRLLLFQR
jgi:flavin-dependent dehydrogenase